MLTQCLHLIGLLRTLPMECGASTVLPDCRDKQGRVSPCPMSKSRPVLSKIFVLVFAFIASVPFSMAQASMGISTADIGSSRRAVKALMNEWQDDELAHTVNRRWLCLNAMMPAEGSREIFARNDILWELPDFLMNRSAPSRSGAPVSLRQRVRILATRSELLPNERGALQNLDSRTIEDRLDELRWLIDLHGLLMELSNRLYRERWESHLSDARSNPTYLTAAQDPVSLCLAAQIRAERNRQLTRGAERLLALFDLLQFEEDREFGGGGGARPR